MSRYTRRRPGYARRLTSVEKRRRRENRIGMAICGACLLMLAGMFYGAFKIDQAHGITVQQSLENWGF